MINSFKEGGENYNVEIGNINNGSDYIKNTNNAYTLYIPMMAINKKDKHNGIMLFIHGAGETKENMEHLCRRYAKSGYITATMDYTGFAMNNSNVFRIMDEITYCLTDIKNRLINEYKFNGDKLELAIGGFSVGSQFTMLYGYSMKKSCPLPIKFLINQVGYLDSDPNYWYKVAVNNVTISDVEPNTVDEGIENKTLVKFSDSEYLYLSQMNLFLGKRYTIDELNSMLDENKCINHTNELYISFYNSSKYFFVTYHINNTINTDGNFIPILCVYAGNDENIGVSHFKHLRQLQEINNNLKLDIIYMRYSTHFLDAYYTENGIEAMRDINYKILEYAKTYFYSDDL